MSKKRGAPLGNNNAFKHGFYSNAFSTSELKRLDAVDGEYKDEIDLMRLLIARTAKTIHDQPQLSLEDVLAAQRTITLAVGALSNLIRTQKQIYAGQNTLEQALAELKKLDPDID